MTKSTLSRGRKYTGKTSFAQAQCNSVGRLVTQLKGKFVEGEDILDTYTSRVVETYSEETHGIGSPNASLVILVKSEWSHQLKIFVDDWRLYSPDDVPEVRNAEKIHIFGREQFQREIDKRYPPIDLDGSEGTFTIRSGSGSHEHSIRDNAQDRRLMTKYPLFDSMSYWAWGNDKNAINDVTATARQYGKVAVTTGSRSVTIPPVRLKIGNKFILHAGEWEYYVEGNYLYYNPKKIKESIRRSKIGKKAAKHKSLKSRLTSWDLSTLSYYVMTCIEVAGVESWVYEVNRSMKSFDTEEYGESVAETLPDKLSIDLNRGEWGPVDSKRFGFNEPYLQTANNFMYRFKKVKLAERTDAYRYVHLLSLLRVYKKLTDNRPLIAPPACGLLRIVDSVTPKLWGMSRGLGKVIGEKELARALSPIMKDWKNTEAYRKMSRQKKDREANPRDHTIWRQGEE